MKTAFLINGFKLDKTTKHSDYDSLREMLKIRGYTVSDSEITWNNRTVTEFANDFEAFYLNNETEENIVIGNSLGAIVALMASPAIAPDKLILCSLSAFFKEDLEKYEDDYLVKRFGERRVKDLRGLSVSALIDRLNQSDIDTYFLYGSEETHLYPKLVNRVRASAQMAKDSHLIQIDGAGHRMHEADYVRGIQKILTKH